MSYSERILAAPDQTAGSLITITAGSPSATLSAVYRQPVLLQNNGTLTLPAPANYFELVAEILQDGTGFRTITWVAPVGWTILWNGSASPNPLNTVASKRTDQMFRFFPADLLIRASNIWVQV